MNTQNKTQVITDAEFTLIPDKHPSEEKKEELKVEIKQVGSISLLLQGNKEKLARIEETIKRKQIEKKDVLKAIRMLEQTRDQLNKLTK